jgi:hypothetical protein
VTDAKFLQTVGQGALPLLIVYLESRRPIRLPRRVVLIGISLRWLVCMELLGGLRPSVRLVVEPPRVVARIVQGYELAFWPGSVA